MAELTTLGAVIKATYESEPDTNAFTDAEKSKLGAIDPENIGAVKSVNSKTGEVVLTHEDVGALPDDYQPPVTSVNGSTGDVVLTAEDVGALPDDYVPPAAPVQSVNGKTGVVELDAEDVGALPDSYTAPVESVNGKQGAVILTAADVNALPSSYTPPAAPVQSVNGQTGEVVLTHEDVGALPDDYEPPAAPVQSVNSKTGDVTLTHEDVGALPDDYEPPVTSVNGKTGDVTIGISDISGLQLLLEDLESRVQALEEAEPGGGEPEPEPEPELGFYDGGMPDGFVSKITMPDEENIKTYEVTTSTFSDEAVENAEASVRFILAPGNYVNVGPYKDFYAGEKDFIHIVGKEQAWVDGAPNPNGTYFHGITSWINGTIVLENLIFDGTSDYYDEQGGADYAVYLHRETNVQIKNCVFNGQYLHDISFKRAQSIGEVIGNVFRNSARHSVEIGQECNYFSDNTQVEDVSIVGNDFEGNEINCITIQSSKKVVIDSNRFHNAGRIVRVLVFNKTPESDVKLLDEPLRTEFTNNTITGDSWTALWFAGRGRDQDSVLIKGNTGLTSEDFFIDPLHPDDAALFSAAGNPVDTLDGPTLDPESDVIGGEPPPVVDAPVVEGYSSGAAEDVQTDHVINLPAGFRINERIYVFLSIGGSDNLTIPEGWDTVYWTTAQFTGVCISRDVDGSESATITVTSENARMSSYVAVRVSKATVEDYDYYNDMDNPTNSEVPFLAPETNNQEYLWLTGTHWRQGTRTLTPPDNFTLIASGDTGYAGFAENHTSVAEYIEETASLQPSDWVSNQVDTEGNNSITSLLAIVGGGEDPGAVVITDAGPIAVNDVNTTDEETPLNVSAPGVLANDTDANGDPLTVVAVNDEADDVGEPVAGSNGGIFTINANGSYTFDPNGDFDALYTGQSDTTSVTYTVSDGEYTDSATLTITVNGVGEAPPPADFPVVEGYSSGAAEDTQTDHVIPLPTGFRVNERIYIFLTIAGSDELTYPEGWDVIYDPTNQLSGVCLTRVVDGSEGASITVTGPVARVSSYVAIRVSGVLAHDYDYFNSTDNVTNSEVPDLTPSAGNQKYLWLTATHWRQGTRTLTPPNDFDLVASADTGFAGFAENHTSVAAREYEGTTLAPTDWVSNQVDTEGNNSITSIFALVGGGPAPGEEVNPPEDNVAPVAVDDVNSTNEDTPLNVSAPGVLANDTDENEGDTLTVVEVNGSGANVGEGVFGSNGGIFIINADGSYTFDPNGDFDLGESSDTTSVTYTVSDGEKTDTATLTITVNGIPAEPGEDVAPVVVATNSGAAEDSQTAHVIPLPAGIQAGDHLFVFLSAGGSDDYTLPAGWTEVYWANNSMTAICAHRVATGSDGSSMTITGSVARYSSFVSIAVRGVEDFEPDWSTTGNDATTAPVLQLSPATGTRNYLFLASIHWRQGTRTLTAPSGYTIEADADTGYDGSAESHTSVASITTEASQNPSGNWASNSVDESNNNYIRGILALYGPSED